MGFVAPLAVSVVSEDSPLSTIKTLSMMLTASMRFIFTRILRTVAVSHNGNGWERDAYFTDNETLQSVVVAASLIGSFTEPKKQKFSMFVYVHVLNTLRGKASSLMMTYQIVVK